MHKTRPTQNMKAKHTSNAKTKTRRGERESDRITWIPFPSTPLKNLFFWVNPWTGGEGKELKLFKFERNMRTLKRSLRGAKEDGNWS